MIRNLGPFSQRQGILPWGCPGISGPISPFIRASWGMRWPGREVPLPCWLPSTGSAAPADLAGPLGSPQGLKAVWTDGEDQDTEGTSDCVWHELHIQGTRGVCLASCCCFFFFFFLPVVVQLLSRVRLFATPWTTTRQASVSFTISRSWLELMSIELS